MPIDLQNLEPAERDPKKLRRTAFILILIMLIGGVLVNLAYQKWSKKQKTDDASAKRPAVISRIEKGRDLRVLRQDGQQVGLLDLSGKVWLAVSVCASQPEDSARSVAVMKELVKRYQENDDVAFVALVIDPGKPEDLAALLKGEADRLGAQLPKWWVASTEPETLHKFIKNEFKTALYPHVEEGKWKYDTSIMVIDRNRHLRHAVIPQKRGGEPYIARFDFDQAGEWDDKGVKTGSSETNVEALEKVLIETIEQLRLEPLKD